MSACSCSGQCEEVLHELKGDLKSGSEQPVGIIVQAPQNGNTGLLQLRFYWHSEGICIFARAKSDFCLGDLAMLIFEGLTEQAMGKRQQGINRLPFSEAP